MLSGTITNGIPFQDYNTSSVTGTPNYTNPVSGSAVWLGNARGIDGNFARVTGNARLEMNFGDSTLDIFFSDFDNGQADMAWNDAQVSAGSFRPSVQPGNPLFGTLYGSFYGNGHEGAAGVFSRDGLNGVFGALRE